jgi:hypothetical protein
MAAAFPVDLERNDVILRAIGSPASGGGEVELSTAVA